MKFNEYYFVLLRRNKEYKSLGDERDNEIGTKHFAFIQQKSDSGELFAAGPLDGAGGIYFFNTEGKTKDDILSLLNEDDSIKYEMFIPEVHKWMIPEGIVIFTLENYFNLKKLSRN
jgi:hypothetical protein